MLGDLYKIEGVPLVDAFGAKYPESFGDPLAEYHALVESTGIIDLTHWHLLEITGEDRARFLNAMLTNDVASLENNTGCHTLMTTPKGKIISEMYVFAGEERHLVIVAQGDFAETIIVLEKHIITEDVTIADVSASYGIIAIEGPKAGSILPLVLRMGPLPKTHLQSVDRDVDDFHITVINNTATGEQGYHLVIPAPQVARVREYLIQVARGSAGMPIGHTAWNTRRIENGIPWFGVDFSGDNFPQEVRLDSAVSYTKGCFRGQETLARIHHRGNVNHVLVGLVPIANDEHTQEKEKPLGRVTSTVNSPRLERPLSLGFVRHESSAAGSNATVKTPDRTIRTEIIELPLPPTNPDRGQ
jgi:folate-binding protein YgfZ